MYIKFKHIRGWISGLGRVSICMKESTNYYNYRFMEQVPHSFDECFVYGVRLIESDFDKELDPKLGTEEGPFSEARVGTKSYTFEHCLEIRLSLTPHVKIEEDTQTEEKQTSLIIYHRTFTQKYLDLDKEFVNCRYAVRLAEGENGYLLAVSPSPESDEELQAYVKTLPFVYGLRGKYEGTPGEAENVTALTDEELNELFNW